MRNSAMMAKIAMAIETASAGVDYSPRTGATCPWCGRRSRIYKTMPWEDTTRIRYHQCENHACVMASMRISIKSIEVDPATA
jgi:hypothetical protein